MLGAILDIVRGGPPRVAREREGLVLVDGDLLSPGDAYNRLRREHRMTEYQALAAVRAPAGGAGDAPYRDLLIKLLRQLPPVHERPYSGLTAWENAQLENLQARGALVGR